MGSSNDHVPLYSTKCRYKMGVESTDEQMQMWSTPLMAGPILSTQEKYLSMALRMGKYTSLGFLKSKTDWQVIHRNDMAQWFVHHAANFPLTYHPCCIQIQLSDYVACSLCREILLCSTAIERVKRRVLDGWELSQRRHLYSCIYWDSLIPVLVLINWNKIL